MVDKNESPKAAGGKARADALSAEERRQIAKKAAAARWGEKPLKATHKGNFREDFGFDVECYVIDDDLKTAVISQRGMGETLGLGEGGSRLPAFIKGQKISPYVGHELREKLSNPMIFQGLSPGSGAPAPTIYGYDVTILIDICNAVVTAESEGKLLKSQAHIAKQARIILGASGKAGIQGLVYALAGYDRTKEEIVAAFRHFVQEEARKYEQEFPNELYLAWHRLYKIPVPTRGKPWKWMHLTRKHIYYPLAQSSGKVLDLLRALRDRDPKKKKLFQFLNEIGVRALRIHMGRILEMAESSATSAEYEAKFAARFGRQQELDLTLIEK
ncbi:P63C domain-containing protein [Pseudomonas sp. A014]|uniref:P63C domain-containing protein n=1 Tax=Pseudomonas sp. A014 TaxID=3458058 RepID=UPI0040364151